MSEYNPITTLFLTKILIKKGNSFLLLKNKKYVDDPKNGWETPGGHMEKNEDFEQSLFRELKEETGLTKSDIDILCPIHTFLFYPGEEKSLGGIVYLANYRSGNISLDSHEHDSYKWMTLDEIKGLEGTKGMRQEFEAYKKFIRTLSDNLDICIKS